MKTSKTLILLFLSTLLTTSLLSQPISSKKATATWIIQQGKKYSANQANLTTTDFFQKRASTYQLSSKSTMQLEQSEPGVNGWSHHKFHQYHEEIPVFGATYILHTQHEKVQYANGYFRPQITASSTPTLNKSEALQRAMQEMGARIYSWHPNTPRAYFEKQPTPTLVYIDPEFPEVSNFTKLAYAITLSSWEPLDKKLFFIDAQTGELLQSIDKMHQHAVPATGVTRYYGTQSFLVDSIAPNQFLLQDPTRGDGIKTTNYDLEIFENHSRHWDLTNDQMDEVALDAHYCSSKFHDLLKEEYNWFGIDNNGGEMHAVVHYGAGSPIVNAFWNGTFATFADGDCKNGPLTTLEVVGHEFMHGVIDYTSELVYSRESGAINESMADVFGKVLEYKEDPSRFNWELGRSFQIDQTQDPFRSFADPNSLNMPAFYKGTNWSDGAGVHTNSSVGNHWFYILSEGIDGVNELGQSYSVDSFGIEKAGQLVFLINRSYLTSSSNYPAYHEASLQAAEELFGPGSPEITAVAEAWKAVGLPWVSNIQKDIMVSVENRTQITCEDNAFIPIEFLVSNTGLNTFVPDSDDHVTISYNLNGITKETDIPLTQNIEPGTAQIISIDTLLFAEEDFNIYITIQLPGSIDENFQNNTTSMLIRNRIHQSNELSITGTIGNYDCTKKTYNSSLYLQNNSCTTMTAGSSVLLSIKDEAGNVYWTENYILENDINATWGQSIYPEITIDWAPLNYILSATFTNDPVLSNNETEVDFWKPHFLSIEYFNDFESLSAYGDSLQIGTYLNPAITTFNGNQYFSASGRFQTPFLTFCPEAEDNLNGDFGNFNSITAELIGCVDFSGYLSPTVDFDLIQFTNPNLEEPSPLSTILEFSYEDIAGAKKEIIYGQEEGQTVNYSMSLPDEFEGAVRFKFSNQSGVSIDQSDFFEYDVNLLDNLHFSALPVATKTPSTPKLAIFPNPVSDQLYIQDANQITSYQIVNTQGLVLATDYTYDGQAIDLSNLPNGYYWLTTVDQSSKQVITPFVKLNQ